MRLVKDLFLHFSLEDIHKAISNIKRSGSKYLLVNSGRAIEKNRDIETGGGYRYVNLEAEPFNFPQPIDCIDLKVFQSLLMLWEINDIVI